MQLIIGLCVIRSMRPLLSAFIFLLPQMALSQTAVRDSVQKLFALTRVEDDAHRMDASTKMERLLAGFYADATNFEKELDSVPFIGQLTSPDGLVRMTCWNIAFEDGGFHYHCILRHRDAKGKVSVTVFEDSDVDWGRMLRKPIRPTEWYGALYYRILSNKHRGTTYYTLLGWDGKDAVTNRKVVDVLRIQGNSVVLGATIFDGENKTDQRLVFEYANDASMALNFDEKEKMIIMDHLSPEDSRFEGQYQFYGPDFSYDALRFKKGKWVLIRDVFAKNRGLNNLPEHQRPGSFND